MTTSYYVAAGLGIIFFLSLLGGYQFGSDAANRDNRAAPQKTQVQQQ